MKTYAMMILGCKVNDYEATYVRENMNKYFKEVSFKDKADIYLIFTCCVTNTAEAKTRKFIHDAKRNNKDAYVVAIGCMSQIKGDSEAFETVDLIIGSNNKDRIVELILADTKANLVNEDINEHFEVLNIQEYPTKSRAFLKIQDGCNQFCSYCIIPYARGRQRCPDHSIILKQAKTLALSNKEIVLTGIHTGRYDDGQYDLYHLLKDLNDIQELETIRLSSIEINEINDDIIDLMKNSNKIAHHLHIPVQSCDDTILKLMNRPYTIEEYMERINYIRNNIPNISISTDLIVGFPFETDELFNNTLDKLKQIKFSFIHIFPYSRKTNTVADKMDNQIDNKIKKERLHIVADLQKDITKQYQESFKNKIVKVLIEKHKDQYSYGYTKEYIYTKISGIHPIGSIKDVKIIDVDDEVIGDVVI